MFIFIYIFIYKKKNIIITILHFNSPYPYLQTERSRKYSVSNYKGSQYRLYRGVTGGREEVLRGG